MYDLLLIRPNWSGSGVSYPLGLMYVQSYVKSKGYTVKLMDLSYDDMDWSLIKDNKVKVVGITMLSRLRESGYELIHKIRSLNEDIKIVIGGVHASSLPELIVNNFPVDAAVIGEGEESMGDLMDLWINGYGELEHIPGIATPEFGIHSQRELIHELDRLPFPDMTDINPKNFVPPIMKIKPRFEINGVRLGEATYANMITSRGCLGRCKFCNIWKHWEGKVRLRSPKNVVDEIEELNKMGINLIEFNDDSLAQNRKIMVEICQEIIDRKLNVAWYSAIRPDLVDKELLEIMHRAGCFMLAYGVESGSQKILDNIGKNTKREDLTEAIKITKEVGIKAYALLMIGNLGEDDRTINETVEFMEETIPDLHSVIGRVWVYPDTEYCEIMEVPEEFWLDGSEMPFFEKGFTLDDCDRWNTVLNKVPKPWFL